MKERKMPTTKPVRLIDIAREAKVSPTTVGYVLQGSGGKNIRVAEETAQRIREIAEKLNYRPNQAARQLAGKRSKTIGILMDPKPLMINSIRLAQMGFKAKEAGYHLIIVHEYPTPASIDEAVDELISRGVDGVICMHHIYPEPDIDIPKVVSQKFSKVVFIDPPSISNATFAAFDYEDSAIQMMEYLYNKGHRRIAFATTNLDWHSPQSLYNGYIKSSRRLGLEIEKDLIWVATDHGLNGDSWYTPPKYTDIFIEKTIRQAKADVVFTANDHLAVQIITQLKNAGIRVPDDVAVAGSGNYDIGRLISPQLTTTDQKFADVAHEAVNLLVDMIEKDKKKDKSVLIKADIIERESA
ncbi:MAG: LacI family DNA-binding transcriptional regulator [Sedimentisphaeraceae bacterium JB056]